MKARVTIEQTFEMLLRFVKDLDAEEERPGLNGHDVNAAISAYRPPAVVADIARDVKGRGRYAARQRPPGLAAGHARTAKTGWRWIRPGGTFPRSTAGRSTTRRRRPSRARFSTATGTAAS